MILTDTGKIYSFGSNRYGELGLGDNNNRNTPTLINQTFNGKPVNIL
jgi:alpha-tubulin suppressor-like RCC1 family protein